MAQFVARRTFHIPGSIPKTYFLGHHHAGANKIKTSLPNVSIVIECRDFRLPLSTQNPGLERAIAGRQRIIIYTKSDLGTDSLTARQALRKFYGDSVIFWDKHKPATTYALLKRLEESARAIDSLVGLRAIVVGMPNVGKSTLLNSLRSLGISGKVSKAAKTGDQAGVTRKLGTAVRIVPSEDMGGVGGGVFLMDSPGIFQPYVHNGETMIKIALAHGIKKGLIQDEILADYLLYRFNKWDPSVYRRYSEPTNDVYEFLSAVARKDGKLRIGGVSNLPEAAARVLSQWRDGKLGRFVLDDLSETSISTHQRNIEQPQQSMSQAKKQQKIMQKRQRENFAL